MQKIVAALFTLALPLAPCFASEGMWMPQQIPQIAAQLKAAGLKLNPASLSKLSEFPMGAIVALPGCSASFVSGQGLVVTNHHCAYASITYNSRPGRNLLADGFLAKTTAQELPGAPGSRVWVTVDAQDVSGQILSAATVRLQGKARVDAIDNGIKALVADCEKDPGHRCSVASYYGGLAFYRMKQLEIKDVRLVYAPPEGVGNFGGDTDNFMWPRHTGDFSFLRAYVGKDGKPAEFRPDNVPYVPKHFLRPAKEGLKEGDFVMAAGYPGRTSRLRLPIEVDYTFQVNYPDFVRHCAEQLAIIDRETKGSEDKRLKYANQVASINNAYKYRQSMLDSYAQSDLPSRKRKEFANLKTWVNADAARRAAYGPNLDAIERLIHERDSEGQRNALLDYATPRLLSNAATLYRLANESLKPEAERKTGFQARDLPRLKVAVTGLDSTYEEEVDKALVLHFLAEYAALPAAQRTASFDAALGIKDGMGHAGLKKLVDTLYAGSRLGSNAESEAWLDKKPDDFKQAGDSFIKIAVAMYDANLKREAEAAEVDGKIEAAYANYMQAYIAYMRSKGRAVYPDANASLRITYGKVAGRPFGVDGTTWTAFTTLDGIVNKATGAGEFNAPKAQLDAIKAKNFGAFAAANLKSVPVNFLATLDISGGNSGSATLNAKGELVGLAFDNTFDSAISDWDYDAVKARSIQVDMRYVLWQMRQVDMAANLIKEMGVE